MSDRLMLEKDFKESQRRENYRRAEAFLIWKLGSAGYDEAKRFLRGSGMDWPSLFVEFAEKIEEHLLERMRNMEAAWWESRMANATMPVSEIVNIDEFYKLRETLEENPWKISVPTSK